MLVDPLLIPKLGIQPQLGLGKGLIPEVQPRPECHIRCAFCDCWQTRCLQCFQLGNTFGLGFRQYIFGFGTPLFVVVNDHTALPAAIRPLADGSGPVFSSLCHKLLT